MHDEILNEEISVIRGQNGLCSTAKVVDIVVGDIVTIEAGMRVPADCILLNGLDVSVDEAPYYEDRETIIEKSLSLGYVDNNNHSE